MNRYERNYKNLMALLDPIPAESALFKAPGYMDLGVDRLSVDDKGRHIIALSHYFKHSCGDMIADPDMEIRLDHRSKTVEALALQDSFGYQRVYLDDGRFYPKLKKSLNAFLSTWLKNLKEQGHKRVPAKTY